MPDTFSDFFTFIPHPHIEARKAAGPPKVAEVAKRRNDDKGPISRFNARFALGITVVVGTMWCAYVFTMLAFVALPSAIKTGSLTVLVNWLSSNFLQLVLLPIIIVGQNVQAAAADKRAEATYNDADAVLHTAIEIQKHLVAQDAALEKLLAAAAPRS